MQAFSRFVWVRVSNGSNRACWRNLAVLPCLWVLVCRLPRVKRAFGVFIRRAVEIFVRLSRFICRAFGVFLCKCRRLARLACSFGRLIGYNWRYSHFSNHTGAIIPTKTITKVTIPFVIDRYYCLPFLINKTNANNNVNLSRRVLTKCKCTVK